MNFLSKLIEDANKGNFSKLSGITHKFEPGRLANNALSKSPVCFCIGEYDAINKLAFIPELFRLPFDCCWFDGISSEGDNTGVMCENTDDGVYCSVFVKRKKDNVPAYICDFLIVEIKSCGNVVFKKFAASDCGDLNELISYVVFGVGKFLSAINCSNVRRIEIKPDEKLQKARFKRGKRPLFSYWILDLCIDGDDEINSSGSSVSRVGPRVHLRRGHARRIGAGRWCWVNACVVGNKDSGIVHKDYSLLVTP